MYADTDVCEALAQLLKRPKSKLHYLDLSESEIGSSCLKILSKALASNKSIKRLRIDCLRTGRGYRYGYYYKRSIDAYAWRAFAKVLSKRNSPIESLCIGGLFRAGIGDFKPSLTDDGMSALGKALKTNTTLKQEMS